MNQPIGGSDPLSSRSTLRVGDREFDVYRLDTAGMPDLDRVPMTVKVLLENVLRNAGSDAVGEGDIRTLASWRPGGSPRRRCRSCPPASCSRTSRACPPSSTSPRCATRWPHSAATRRRINPLVPADLVIDHSVQVDRYGTADAFAFNVDREYERNGERYPPALGAERVPRLLASCRPAPASSTR